MIIYAHRIHRHRNVGRLGAFTGRPTNSCGPLDPDRRASGDARKKPPIETFAVAMGLEQTAISGDANACS